MTVRYPVTVMQRARALRGAGWSLRKIGDLVERETGHHPSLNTLAVWVDETQAVRQRERDLRRHRSYSAGGATGGGILGCSRHSREYQEARARRLLEDAGMTQRSVARVMSFDYPGHRWNVARVHRLAHSERTAA